MTLNKNQKYIDIIHTIMKTYLLTKKTLKLFFLFFLAVYLSACAVPEKKPIERSKEVEDVLKSIEKDRDKKTDIYHILLTEAEKFSLEENYQDALFIYNQAMSHATADQRPELTLLIESVLSKTPTWTIQEFLEIRNIQLPKSLLMYWLGLNLALEDKSQESKEVLEAFLDQFPDHPYASDAADLVKDIKKFSFNRNTIGCLLPLTGKYAIFGQRALTGIQLAIQELSKKYSTQFKIIIKDTQADPQKAIEGVRQLHRENVVGIVGPLLTVNEAGFEAEKLKIPMIALTQKSDFPLQGDYLFANFITPQMQVRTLGTYLFADLGIKKVAILYPDETYGRTYMTLFWDIVDEYSGEVVGVESYDGEKTDFTEPIQKLTGEYYPMPDVLKPDPIETQTGDLLIDAGNTDFIEDNMGNIRDEEEKEDEEKIQIDFEALFIPDSPSKINLILPQLAFNDAKDMYLVGTNLWHHKSLLKDSKGYNKNTIITDGFFDNSQNSFTALFTKDYERLFNARPKFLEAISFDTASILFLTAMDETIASRKMLKDALQSQRIFEGVTGNTVFDQNGTAHRDLFLMTIRNGKFVEISR